MTLNEIQKARQDKILSDRMHIYNAIPGCRVGDWIREINGRLTRATHDWNQDNETDQVIQHGGGEYGQFYLGNGYISYSGGLDTGITKNTLHDTGEIKKGKVWFFIDDYHTSHNSIEYMVDFRVYEVINDIPR